MVIICIHITTLSRLK